MNNENYLHHLLSSMFWQKQNALNQKGKTDIEPGNCEERIEKWHNQLIETIIVNPPRYYVDAIIVYDDENDNVVNIDYLYYVEQENIESKLKNTVVNIKWI